MAYRLAQANTWHQLFTADTSHRQISFHNLNIIIISIIKDDDELRPFILSSSIILEGESSQQKCDAILDMIQRRAALL